MTGSLFHVYAKDVPEQTYVHEEKISYRVVKLVRLVIIEKKKGKKVIMNCVKIQKMRDKLF